MVEIKETKNREKFLQAYANLPLGVRKEIILVLDGEPLTWDVAYLEVKNNTSKGEEILHKLESLDLI